MGLFDWFAKFINEHGSAVILKERIELANEKYAELKQELSTSSLRANELEAENQRIRLDLEKLQEKVLSFEENFVESHGQRLEKVREEFLQLLVAHSHITSSQIAREIGKSSDYVTFHLTQMQKVNLVLASYYIGGDTGWSLSQGGRAYLASHGLLA
jgi:chromosome segregation ATPase